jgi:hypothetical protein
MDFLDDLAVSRDRGKPAAPAVFLSGNGPLVEVLQDALKAAGGGGKVFVRGVRDYVEHFSRSSARIPPDHLIVFDEAQRAFDAEYVDYKRRHSSRGGRLGRSEPQLLVEFADRIPEWCVILALIGSGQEIHSGEEGGLAQWREAVTGSRAAEHWIVHLPPGLRSEFGETAAPPQIAPVLSLNTEIRYHLAPTVSRFVESLLEGDATHASTLASELRKSRVWFYLTRSLECARGHVQNFYEGNRDARYGILASSKDRDLLGFDIDNSYQTTKRLRVGRWFNAPATEPESCCRLDRVATEFAAQGLELDMALLAWGTDLARRDGAWSTARSRGYRYKPQDPFRIRKNVYRVLLTRGRDGTVIFIPPDPYLAETAEYLVGCGVRSLDASA